MVRPDPDINFENRVRIGTYWKNRIQSHLKKNQVRIRPKRPDSAGSGSATLIYIMQNTLVAGKWEAKHLKSFLFINSKNSKCKIYTPVKNRHDHQLVNWYKLILFMLLISKQTYLFTWFFIMMFVKPSINW